MSRKTDIFERLDYANERFQELGDKLFNSGMGAVEVRHLAQICGEILSCSREVFDFCASDIAEIVIIPKDSGAAADAAAGKLRCYYPFNKSQLTKKTALFHKLKQVDRSLYDFLYSIAARIERRELRQGTLINYGVLLDVAEMVNQKKHDCLLKVVPSGSETIFAQVGGARMMFPLSEQKGVSTIALPSDAKHSRGDQYIFEFNKQDIMRFSMQARSLARMVMTDIYANYLT